MWRYVKNFWEGLHFDCIKRRCYCDDEIAVNNDVPNRNNYSQLHNADSVEVGKEIFTQQRDQPIFKTAEKFETTETSSLGDWDFGEYYDIYGVKSSNWKSQIDDKSETKVTPNPGLLPIVDETTEKKIEDLRQAKILLKEKRRQELEDADLITSLSQHGDTFN